MRPPITLVLGLASLTSCAVTSTAPQHDFSQYDDFVRGRDMVAQGWLGIGELQANEFDEDPQLPVIGGAFQQPLGGNGKVNLGFEGGISFEWEGNIESFAAGGGGLVIRTENDLLVFDLFAGPYGELLLGQRWRLYGAVGGVLEFAHVDADIDDPTSGSSSASDDAAGGGIYGRGGLEYVLPSGASFGFGVRYVDTDVDFGGPLGSYDLERIQYLFTLTRNI